jgi:CubicO group peptidase (beta-lactamase class C family)
MHGHQAYYAWGFGGQMLYVIPSLGLTVVMSSNSTEPSREDNYVGQLHALVTDGLVPAFLPKHAVWERAIRSHPRDRFSCLIASQR